MDTQGHNIRNKDMVTKDASQNTKILAPESLSFLSVHSKKDINIEYNVILNITLLYCIIFIFYVI